LLRPAPSLSRLTPIPHIQSEKIQMVQVPTCSDSSGASSHVALDRLLGLVYFAE
jgi:hypothetical protein